MTTPSLEKCIAVDDLHFLRTDEEQYLEYEGRRRLYCMKHGLPFIKAFLVSDAPKPEISITLTLGCGPKTCYNPVTGKTCSFRSTMRLGTSFHCSIFNNVELKDQHGKLSGEGMLQRVPECLIAESK
jgi:hypothetical protein